MAKGLSQEHPSAAKWRGLWSLSCIIRQLSCTILLFLYSQLYNLTTYSVITMQSMAAKLNFTQGDIDDFRIKIALDFAEMEVQ
jgi:hypothetical protein